jgi:predicted glycoside hydrolase/deacetylase ChbG (UPF0249 family)
LRSDCFKSTDKILIINVDDVGNSHAANAAVIDAMENGLATSSTIIVPGRGFGDCHLREGAS